GTQGDDRDQRELLRVVTWQLDAGAPVEPERLAAAARLCIHTDTGLAERLAREAYERGAGFEAVDVLAQVNQFTQRPADTEALLADVDVDALSPADRVRSIVLRANN